MSKKRRSPPQTLASRSISSLRRKTNHRVNIHSSLIPRANIEETQRFWQMRWCFFWVGIVLSILWMVAMVVMSLYVFDVTRNFLSLFISAASALAVEFMRRFANYLLPMDERRFQLKAMKIKTAQSRQRQIGDFSL